MRNILLLTVAFVMLAAMESAAQSNTELEPRDFERGWYIGLQGGIPTAEATFSSFGADRFRPGWEAGLHAGYRFNHILALEATAAIGQVFMSEQDCCFDSDYLLGADWNRWKYPTADFHYYPYSELKSHTQLQRYGLHLNINMLGFFPSTRDSRWRLELAPSIYAVGSSSDLRTKSDDKLIVADINSWHFGYGGRLQASYALTERLDLGIYGGFAHHTGSTLDAMPQIHLTNFVIDAGLKLTYAIGTKPRAKSAAAAALIPAAALLGEGNDTAEQGEVANEEPAEVEVVERKAMPQAPPAEVSTEIKPAVGIKAEPQSEATTEPQTEQATEVAEVEFPVIYFSFNSVWIEPSERGKVKEISEILKANPEMRIRVTGSCCEIGGEEVNKRVSLQRAEAVKRVLGQWLIPAERVETVGAGIAHNAPSRKEARNATVIEIIK